MSDRKIRFRSTTANGGFDAPDVPPVPIPRRRATTASSWGTESNDGDDGAADAAGAFTLPSIGKRSGCNGEQHQARKVVLVARQDAATGATTWEEVEVRYGKPKLKPFAINCTFGLPRVLNKDSANHAASPGPPHRLPPASLTPQPTVSASNLLGNASVSRSGSPPGYRTKDSPGAASGGVGATPGGASSVASRWGRVNKHVAPAKAVSTFVSITDRIADARRINGGSFEAFVRPRSGFPASENARKNVPPHASVARARRRHTTGDSSSDSDNEIDADDLSERLQKLNQRRTRLLRDLRLSGGVGARKSMSDVRASMSFGTPAQTLHDGPAADGSAPPTTVDVSLAMVDYEIAWVKEQVRRIREQEHQQDQQLQAPSA